MLQNPIHRGEIVHNNRCYPGEHAAIVDPALSEAVQRQLAANAVDRRSGERAKHPSLLAGLLFDGDGHRMTPTHAIKNGVRYRYYVSRPLTIGSRDHAPAGQRLPTAEIERLLPAASAIGSGNLLPSSQQTRQRPLAPQQSLPAGPTYRRRGSAPPWRY
jgi:site-specific DNA recombinase